MHKDIKLGLLGEMWWSEIVEGPDHWAPYPRTLLSVQPTSPEETLLSAVVQSRRAGIRDLTPAEHGEQAGLCLVGGLGRTRSPWNPGFGISCANSPCWLMSHRSDQPPGPVGWLLLQPALALGCPLYHLLT